MDTAAFLTNMTSAFGDGMTVAAGIAPLAIVYALAWSLINRGRSQVK